MTEGLVRNQLSSKERREGQAETGHQGMADELGVEVESQRGGARLPCM